MSKIDFRCTITNVVHDGSERAKCAKPLLSFRKYLLLLAFIGCVLPLCTHAQTITGGGAANTVPVLTGTSTIGNSVITQPSTSLVVVGSSLQVEGPSPWVDVKAYGATGNGTTNDAPAIQSAINAAGTGGTVFFPCGKYYIETGLTENNVAFRMTGEGGTSFLNTGANCATIESDQNIVLLTTGKGSNNSNGGTIDHLAFRDISTAGAGYNSSRCPSYDLPCGGNAVGGIYIDGTSFMELQDLELDGFSGSREYGIELNGGTFWINHDHLQEIKMNECQYCVIITGYSDGPDMEDMYLYPGSPITGVSGSIGIDCQSGCASVHVHGGKCTVAASSGTCVYTVGTDSEFDWQLESYTASEGATCCQNIGIELGSTATRNLVTVSATRFTTVVQLDAGSSRSTVTGMGVNNTNIFVNNSTAGTSLLINGATGTIAQSQ